MPIRINILAEQQHEADVRRRDPVKRAVTVAVLIVASVLCYYGWLLTHKGMKNSALANTKAALTAIEPDAAAARIALDGVKDLEGRVDALNNLATNRVLWGTFMNSLQKAVIVEVPISQVRVVQGYDVESPPPLNGIPMPATTIQKITVMVSGRDYGRSDDLLYDVFRKKLEADEWMAEQLDEEIKFEPFGVRTPDRNDTSKYFLPFTMRVNFKKLEFR